MNRPALAALACALAAALCIFAQSLIVPAGTGGPRAAAGLGIGAMALLFAAAVFAIKGLRHALKK